MSNVLQNMSNVNLTVCDNSFTTDRLLLCDSGLEHVCSSSRPAGEHTVDQ